MKAARVGTTMKEECLEILQAVQEALAQEMPREMQPTTHGAPGCSSTDGARLAACLYLRRAALNSVMMERELAAWKPAQRRPAPAGWPAAHRWSPN